MQFGNAVAGSSMGSVSVVLARLFRSVAIVMLAGSMAWVSGCATQAALVDVQTDLETERGKTAVMADRVAALEKVLQDRSSSGQRSQVDAVVRLDEIASDLQAVQGRLEEQAHTLSNLSKAADDQAFRLSQVTARLETAESRLLEQERRGANAPAGGPLGSVEPPPMVPPAQDRVVLPGRTPRGGLSPVEAYNLAYNDYVKGSYELAIQGFQSFLQQYPTSILVPHALYWLGESFYQTKQFPQAIEQYNRLATQYPKSEKLPGALLKSGFAYASVGDKGKARGALRRILEDFPHASEANLAKEKLAELR